MSEEKSYEKGVKSFFISDEEKLFTFRGDSSVGKTPEQDSEKDIVIRLASSSNSFISTGFSN